MAGEQVWTLEHRGQQHRVTAVGPTRHQVRWYVDGELRAEKTSVDDKLRIRHDDGVLDVRFSALGSPRRASLGDVDLVPEPGSPAATFERKVLDHPTRYSLLAALTGVAKVVVPILLASLALRFAVRIPWPDLPSIPLPDLPDLPSIPWPDLPDLPSIPWPDVTLPDWLVWLLDHAHYVWPVVLAVVLARAEVRRRRQQEERRAAGAGGQATNTASDIDDGASGREKT